ncbi:MAG: metalloregulator ArsR/SmtB family transcription factor [Desulfosudaceae bacterium]
MDITKYFKALSDETRLRLLNLLLHHELKVGEMVAVLEMGQSRISRHLKILVEAGLLNTIREGTWGLYLVADSGPGHDLVESIRYLFEDNDLMQADLVRAAGVIKERRLSTQRFFNTIADRWGLLKQEILGDFDLNRVILKEVGRHSVAVDLGCGTGDLLEVMFAHAGKVIGVDSSPGMLDQARKRFNNHDNRVEIRLGELEHLPLSDQEASLAITSLVLQYLDEPEAAIAEVSRVVRPGGCFLIADLERHQQAVLREKYGARWLGFDTEKIKQWLLNQGFDLTSVERYPLKQGLAINIFQSRRQTAGASPPAAQ